MTAATDPGNDADLAATLSARLAEVRERMAAAAARAGRAPSEVTLVAVTKTVPSAVVRIAATIGLDTFGENRVQEAQEKIGALGNVSASLRWELIGHLQTNKAARAADLFSRIQSVDSLRLAEALNAHAGERGAVLPVLIEVNVAGEASKSGFAPEQLLEVARMLVALPHLRVEGLMTVAPQADDAESVRPVFRRLRALRDTLAATVPTPSGGWHELSMGMTDDYEVAIEEGATIIRVGRALFGARPPLATH